VGRNMRGRRAPGARIFIVNARALRHGPCFSWVTKGRFGDLLPAFSVRDPLRQGGRVSGPMTTRADWARWSTDEYGHLSRPGRRPPDGARLCDPRAGRADRAFRLLLAAQRHRLWRGLPPRLA